MSGFYRFTSDYRLAAPASAVFEALRDAQRWPAWWPQIRRVVADSETTGRVWIRSLLPMTLTLQVTSQVVDAERGVLRAALNGDLDGWAQFVVTRLPGGATRLDYRQEATLVRPRLPSAVALAARPVLIANHAVMMRSGVRGLTAEARRRATG